MIAPLSSVVTPAPKETQEGRMASLLGRLTAAICLIGGLSFGVAARAEEPFYAGKRLNILVNFAVGGPTDIEGRLFAKYISRHIAGRPNVLVQNMDGAGGVVGAKYLGEVAPKDGTYVGYFTGTGFIYALDPSRFRADFRTYGFVAIQGGTTIHYVRTDVPPGMKDATDITKAQGIVGGGLSAETSKDIRMRLGLDMLGVPHKYVTGYRSSPAARLAFQKGEINMFSESPPSYRSIVVPDLIDTKQAIPLWYDAYFDGGEFHTPSYMDGLDILPFHELFRKIRGVLPSGKLWENYLAITASDGTVLRTICFPPGTPSAAAAALSDAVVALNADQDYKAEAMATIGFVPEWQAGPQIDTIVQKALSVPPEARTFLNDYIKAANR
jgi:tripartite-type tricarboxylate transporter receptor subunit TctC